VYNLAVIIYPYLCDHNLRALILRCWYVIVGYISACLSSNGGIVYPNALYCSFCILFVNTVIFVTATETETKNLPGN